MRSIAWDSPMTQAKRDTGEGVEQSDKEAVRWYRQAANQGDAAAQFGLGVAYEYGEGVKQNNEEALRWYRLAAAFVSVCTGAKRRHGGRGAADF